MNCPICNVMLSAGDRTLGSCPDGHPLPSESWQDYHGTEGQDRDSYSDDQDRETYTSSVTNGRRSNQAVTLWAAFAGSCYGQEITLHATEREALEACVSALGLDMEWGDVSLGSEHVEPDEDGESRGRVDELSDDELRDHLDDYCSTRSDDWHINEVEIP